MSLIKKIDVDKHFAARRAMRLGRTGPLSETGFRIQRTAKTTSTAAFVEEATPVPVAADPDGTIVSTVTRSRQA
jgi:hypothetical protein